MMNLSNSNDCNEDFRKIGVFLGLAREQAGLTKDEMAARLQTSKSVVSRIEKNAGSMSVSTIKKYVKALGKMLSIEIV